MKKLAVLFVLILLSSQLFAQPSADITSANKDMYAIRRAGLKSRTVWEYHYVPGTEDLSDSGYKSFYYSFDPNGKISEYTKYHIFSDMTIRENYRYGKGDFIDETAKYNSAGEMIKTVGYKYDKSGRLKKENHTAYFNSVRPGVYFSILANAREEQLFNKVQDDLGIEPHLEGYTINVNISDADEQNQYIVIGDESDPTSPRYSWAQLSVEAQRGLLSYQGPNRKEHTYISKNIARVSYKYDDKGNLVERSVYNTSNDQIDRESYKYNAAGKKLNFYKFNENGKLSSMENYSYNDAGLLAETVGLDPEGKTVSRISYKYDDKGSVTEKVWKSPVGEIIGTYRFNYDESGRIKEEMKYRGENEKESTTRYRYDDNGFMLEAIKYNTEDKKEKLIKFIYEHY